MASENFLQLVNDMLEDLKSSVEKGGSKPARKQLIRSGSIPHNTYAINRQLNVDQMEDLFPGFGEDITAQLFREYARIEKAALNEYSEGKEVALEIKEAAQKSAQPGETVFFLRGYSSVQETKGKNLVKYIKSEILQKENFTKDEEKRLGQVGKRIDVGHTQLAASQLRLLRAEQIQDTRSVKGIPEDQLAKLKTVTVNMKTKMNLKMSHKQVLDSKGNILKTYTPELQAQLAKENKDDAKLEAKLIAQYKEELENLLLMPGSLSFVEAMESTLLYNLKGKRGTTNARNKKKESSSHSGKSSTTITSAVNLVKASGASKQVALLAKERRRRKGETKKGTASTPLNLITKLNKELPKAVEDNMNPPALDYDTGRLAQSARVVDITTTPQGFPSVGYTYDRENYGQYEATSGATQWASPERDPRKLIDRSLRDIAKDMAIGRFFTRRV